MKTSAKHLGPAVGP